MQRQNTGARRLPFVLLALLACGALAKGDTIVFRYGDTNALMEGYTGVTDTMLLGGVKTNLDYGGADEGKTFFQAAVFRSAEAAAPAERPQLLVTYERHPAGSVLVVR